MLLAYIVVFIQIQSNFNIEIYIILIKLLMLHHQHYLNSVLKYEKIQLQKGIRIIVEIMF